MRSAASIAMISASVVLWLIAPCFLHIQVRGANVFGPTNAMKAPVVDLLSNKSPANPASQNRAKYRSSGASPTKLVPTQSSEN